LPQSLIVVKTTTTLGIQTGKQPQTQVFTKSQHTLNVVQNQLMSKH